MPRIHEINQCVIKAEADKELRLRDGKATPVCEHFHSIFSFFSQIHTELLVLYTVPDWCVYVTPLGNPDLTLRLTYIYNC